MSQGEVAPDAVVAALKRFVSKYDRKKGGLEKAAEELGLSRLAVLNVLAGREVRSGTIFQLQAKLEEKGAL